LATAKRVFGILKVLWSPDQSGLRGPQSTFPRDPSCLFRVDNTDLADIEKVIFNTGLI